MFSTLFFLDLAVAHVQHSSACAELFQILVLVTEILVTEKQGKVTSVPEISPGIPGRVFPRNFDSFSEVRVACKAETPSEINK